LQAQLDVETKNARKFEKDAQKFSKDLKDIQAAKGEVDKLKQQISSLQKSETDVKRLQSRLQEEQDGKVAAESAKKRLERDLADARSDADNYKAEVDRLHIELENETKANRDMQANLSKLLGLGGPSSGSGKPK